MFREAARSRRQGSVIQAARSTVDSLTPTQICFSLVSNRTFDGVIASSKATVLIGIALAIACATYARADNRPSETPMVGPIMK